MSYKSQVLGLLDAKQVTEPVQRLGKMILVWQTRVSKWPNQALYRASGSQGLRIDHAILQSGSSTGSSPKRTLGSVGDASVLGFQDSISPRKHNKLGAPASLRPRVAAASCDRPPQAACRPGRHRDAVIGYFGIMCSTHLTRPATLSHEAPARHGVRQLAKKAVSLNFSLKQEHAYAIKDRDAAVAVLKR